MHKRVTAVKSEHEDAVENIIERLRRCGCSDSTETLDALANRYIWLVAETPYSELDLSKVVTALLGEEGIHVTTENEVEAMHLCALLAIAAGALLKAPLTARAVALRAKWLDSI